MKTVTTLFIATLLICSAATLHAGIYNMQWPRPAITSAPNEKTTFYAQTDQSSWDDVWIGYGTNPTDPSGWTWVGAWWHSDTGIGKEVSNSFSIASAGKYYYASRWQQGGTYYYGYNDAGQTDQTTLNAEYYWFITGGGGGTGNSLADYSQITGIQYFSYTYDVVPEPTVLAFFALPCIAFFFRRSRSC
jgi:hypothetical protein